MVSDREVCSFSYEVLRKDKGVLMRITNSIVEGSVTVIILYIDVGIAEQHALTLAAGMACEGIRPVTAIYSTFLQRGFDQIVHDICIQKLPVVMCIDRAGIVGADGPTHQGLYDISYLRTLPNIVVMAPKDENELQHMLATAVEYPGPAAIRFPRGAGLGIALDPDVKAVPMGEAELLRDGSDVAILAVGSTVHPALEAASELGADGVGCAVLNARFVKPLDAGCILELVRRCGRVVTVEEHSEQGGFGSAVLELIAAEGLSIPVRVLGAPDVLVEHGETPATIGLSKDDIKRAAASLAGHAISDDA